MVKEWDLELES